MARLLYGLQQSKRGGMSGLSPIADVLRPRAKGPALAISGHQL
jgi:hypothetical protein